MDEVRIPPAGDPFTAIHKPRDKRTVCCTDCGLSRNLIETNESNSDGMHYFVGTFLCKACARRGGVEL
jgi:hypothetical protein